jgi:segregation and condensation protein A
MGEYRVNLDIYNGPLDLLLYLIRRDEVDIYDIPIARITEQYLQYVEMLQRLDPNLAGDFLVLAATLMEVKTRMLLPAASPEEGGEEAVQIDPRAELVRQLLEYKAFKDAAGDLREAGEQRAMRFARTPARPDGNEPTELDLECVQVWDLFEAFRKLMTAIGMEAATHEVIYDDTPIELHAADIVDRLERDGALTFRGIFEGRTARSEIVGLFLALLELIRLGRILALQDRNFGEIRVHLNPNPPADRETDVGAPDAAQPDTAPAAEAQPESAGRHAAAAPPGPTPPSADEPGQYVAEPRRNRGEDDDAGRETTEAGP